MDETSKVINQDEKVIWEGQPQFAPYALSVVPAVIIGLIWSTAISFIGYIFMTHGAPGMFALFFAPFILIGLYMLIGAPLIAFLTYKYIWYVITDKRVILQRGLIGRDFDFVDYDKVESAGVDVGVIDKVAGKNSGSIRIYANRLVYVAGSRDRSGGTQNVPFTLSHITDPYGVFELFKKVSFDVKADINFPNQMRPPGNKGYNTEYKG